MVHFYDSNVPHTNKHASGPWNRDPDWGSNFPSSWKQSLRDPGSSSKWGIPVLGASGTLRPAEQGTLRPATAPSYSLTARPARPQPASPRLFYGAHASLESPYRSLATTLAVDKKGPAAKAERARAASVAKAAAAAESAPAPAEAVTFSGWSTTYDAYHNASVRLAEAWKTN